MTFYDDGYGTQIYFEKGMLHRVDGPAHITPNYKVWAVNGHYHRVDGPAVMYRNHRDGGKNACEWWLFQPNLGRSKHIETGNIDDLTFYQHWNK